MESTIEKETIDLEKYWSLRTQRMLEDRDILNLIKPKPTTDKIKWVSNEPKVFYETACSLISSYPPRFRLPLTINYEPDEKDKMNKAERLCIGLLRSLNAKQFQNYWLRQLAYWALSGWHAEFILVKRRGNTVDFSIDIWDPITVLPQWDNDGLAKCIRRYEVDKKTAAYMASYWLMKGQEHKYKEPDMKDRVKVINYWRRDIVKSKGKEITKVYNAILMDGQEIKPLKHEERFKRIPISIGCIGVPEQTSGDWQSRFGESVIAANRDMYEYENTMVSLMATILAETAYPNIKTKSALGTPLLKGKGLRGYGEEIPLKRDQEIELLKHAATPGEVDVLLSWTGKQKQKGSVPEIVYGGVPFELSGFAISQLMAAIRYKIAPYLTMMQNAISYDFSEALEQYKNGDGKPFPKISLTTTNPTEMRKGLFFIEEFSPSDVPDSLYIDVTIPITSAMDKTQQILFARQAMQPPQLLSRETIWDDILDVQDSEQEYARIIQDEMLEMPIVKQIAMIEQLRVRVEFYRNQGKNAEADALNRYIMMLEMELGMRKGIPETPGAPGMPPEGMPPEMGQSPDSARAALGVGPPGLSRRPQSTEERAESKGRKGRLVSPQGETLI